MPNLTLYFICLLSLLIFNGILALAPFVYQNKYPSELSNLEYKIKTRSANFKEKLSMFFLGMVFSLMFPPNYLIAGILLGLYRLIEKLI